jgi:hypothetical protein
MWHILEGRRGERGKLRDRDRLEDLGADGRIILKWVFKKHNEKHGLD